MRLCGISGLQSRFQKGCELVKGIPVQEVNPSGSYKLAFWNTYLQYMFSFSYLLQWLGEKEKEKNTCYHNPRHDLCQGVNDFGKRERTTRAFLDELWVDMICWGQTEMRKYLSIPARNGKQEYFPKTNKWRTAQKNLKRNSWQHQFIEHFLETRPITFACIST